VTSYRNKTVQLSIPYTDPERHNAQRALQTDGQTDRQTDIIFMPRAEHATMRAVYTIG